MNTSKHREHSSSSFFHGRTLTSIQTLSVDMSVGIILTSAAALITRCSGQHGYEPPNPPNGKQLIIDLMDSLRTGTVAPLSIFHDRQYVEHSVGLADGKAGFAGLVAAAKPTNKINTIRAFQDGDHVIVHLDNNLYGQNVAFDVFRFEHGKVVEHWDNLQEQPAGPNGAGHTMFDGPTEARDHEKTAANKALVRSYATEVYVNGKKDMVMQYFNAGQLLEHNPLTGAGGAAASMARNAALPPGTNVCSRIRKVLGEGNFVLTMCDGTLGNDATAFFDLYRVENGKIAEHWDVIEKIPPPCEWSNLNGKF